MHARPSLIPLQPKAITVEYERRIGLLLFQLRDATNLRDAHFEVLTSTIMQMHALEAALKHALVENHRLRSEWSLQEDIARADHEDAACTDARSWRPG